MSPRDAAQLADGAEPADDANDIDIAVGAARELAGIIHGTELTRMAVTVGATTIELERHAEPATPHAAPPGYAPPAAIDPVTALPSATATVVAGPTMVAVPTLVAAPPVSTTHAVRAPLVGAFYCAAGPGKPPFVRAGDRVVAGQQVAIVEAMKMMNEVTAEISGTIAEVLVEDGQIVEFGQPLVTIEPS